MDYGKVGEGIGGSKMRNLEKLGSNYRGYHEATVYTAQWAEVTPHGERTVLEGHGGRIHAVCPVTVANRELLAAACSDGKVRIYDAHGGGGAEVPLPQGRATAYDRQDED